MSDKKRKTKASFDIPKERLEKLIQDCTVEQIAEMHGVSMGTIQRLQKKYGVYSPRNKKKTGNRAEHGSNLRKKDPTAKHKNQGRHLCNSCRFQGKIDNMKCCDYILYTHQYRGCPAEDCDKYEKAGNGRPE